MFDLNAAVEDWLAAAVSAEPSLKPHWNELADHLISESEARIDAGAEPAMAFAAASDSLGQVADLGAEFRKDGSILSHLYRLSCTEQAAHRREYVALSGAWIILSLIWAGVMFVIEDSQTWAIIAWTLTTYLPLSFLGVMVGRRAEKPRRYLH